MSDKDELREKISDFLRLFAIAFAVYITVWAIQTGNLTPELLAELAELVGNAVEGLSQ